jgi:hypothetical protein
MELTNSRQRVADFGEVFTPDWMVKEMLNLVEDESKRIDSRVLESACGSGNFLTTVLRRKLETVQVKFSANDFEKRNHALLGLMCTYGIELLPDNIEKCRERLLQIFSDFLQLTTNDDFFVAAQKVLNVNIVHADALTMLATENEPIVFPEWSYLGKGQFQRRDFRFDVLTQMSSFGEDTLFSDLGKHEIFIPIKSYNLMTVKEISNV